MKKKFLKVVALGISAMLAVMPAFDVVYASEEETDLSEETEIVYPDPLVVGEEITGNLTVEGFFGAKTMAIPLKSGDTYTFTFKNKSNGSDTWDNFSLAIAGQISDYYYGSADEVIVIRSDGYAWGGAMSDFTYVGSEEGNAPIMVNNLGNVQSWIADMAEGVECTVNITRQGNTLYYESEVGVHTVKLLGTSGVDLPETCYVYFTGEECEITEIETSYSSETVDIPSYEDLNVTFALKEEITGNIYLTKNFAERTEAVTFKSGDTYTFEFTNTSYGEENWDMFSLFIFGNQYIGYQNEILIIRADAYGWGGGMSDITSPINGVGLNRLEFTHDFDWNTWVSEAQAGVDCKVTISRVDNTFVYNAKIGTHTVESTITSGIELPEVCYILFTGEECEITDMKTTYSNPTVEVTEDDLDVEGHISGNLTVDALYYEKTDALEIKSGDKYTFEFDNKSLGTENYHNFFLGIAGKQAIEYVDISTEILNIRADAFGWGGGMSDIQSPEAESGNILVFESDIDWDKWLELVKSGVHCEVTISRDGDTFVYEAKIGDYTVKCTTTSGIKLPETCYVYLTGEKCELTDIKTYVGGKTEEEENNSTEAGSSGSSDEKKDEVTQETGKNSAPETVDKENVITVEEILVKVLEKLEQVIEKTVEIISTDATKVSKDVFDSIKEEGKNLTIGVVDKDNKLQYSWTFSEKSMDNTDMEIDLSINFDAEKGKKEKIEKLTGKDDARYITFNHHGDLPGNATIKTYVGDKYKNGEKIYLYYFDEEQEKVLRVGDKPMEVKGGYVEYTITHCSVYFFMDQQLEGVEKDARSLDDASISVLNSETTEKAPITADSTNNTMVYVVVMLAFAAIAVLSQPIIKKKCR